jgi:hypothetical protein
MGRAVYVNDVVDEGTVSGLLLHDYLMSKKVSIPNEWTYIERGSESSRCDSTWTQEVVLSKGPFVWCMYFPVLTSTGCLFMMIYYRCCIQSNCKRGTCLTVAEYLESFVPLTVSAGNPKFIGVDTVDFGVNCVVRPSCSTPNRLQNPCIAMRSECKPYFEMNHWRQLTMYSRLTEMMSVRVCTLKRTMSKKVETWVDESVRKGSKTPKVENHTKWQGTTNTRNIPCPLSAHGS